MNREQKAAAVEEIATSIKESQAVFAVDYRGISVPQVGELRTRLREADTRFAVVKNTLTERAADQAGAEALKGLLEGPTALAFVKGDAAAAAKTLRDYARETDLLPFKGGIMEGTALTAEDIGAIAKLPSRDILYAQLVNIVAYPVSGLARTLNQLIGGLAVALGQIQEQGLVGGDAPAASASETPAEGGDSATETVTETPDAGDDPDAGPASTPADGQPDQAEGEPSDAS
ncbi:MAG TPA: 50S ribosomal protein L10 [Solirubrobacteraceae bacterium]|nr:50S ribosomal protein L10 [Solirubrobacteraceae bacterium]